MITVACVLRTGGRYAPEWAARLQRGVARHLSLPHRFVCLTDIPPLVEAAGVEPIPLPEAWPGWWSKICLFSPGLLTGPTLYLDLDCIVVGSLDEICAYRHEFTMAHDWNNPRLLCAAAMAWSGDHSFLFEAFAADPARLMHHYDHVVLRDGRVGDQALIEDEFHRYGVNPPMFRHLFGPRSIASFKVDQCWDVPPPDAAVVQFHGLPKMNEIRTGWVPEVWV